MPLICPICPPAGALSPANRVNSPCNSGGLYGFRCHRPSRRPETGQHPLGLRGRVDAIMGQEDPGMSSITRKVVVSLSLVVFVFVAAGYVLGRSSDDKAFRALTVYS